MNFISLQRDVAALYFGVLGKHADRATLEYFAKKLHTGELTASSMANVFINADDGKARLAALDDAEKIQYIYHNTHSVAANEEQLSALQAQLDSGVTLGQLTSNMVNSLRGYEGDDPAVLSQQKTLETTIEQTLFPSYTGNISGYSGAADVQAIYYVLHSAMVADGINFWGHKLEERPGDINKIADLFVNTRDYLTSLNNHDFIKRIFEETFKKTATESDINKYIIGLNNHTLTRGDTVVNMINDIRNDTSSENSAAKKQFLSATHVYQPGELPENKYLETVAALYYGITGYTMNAATLESYSKQLAAGLSTADLLRELAKTPAFSEAVYWEQTYHQLFNTTLSTFVKDQIWEKSGKDAYVANSILIETFLNFEAGEYNRGWVYNAKSYEKIADTLGYTKKAVLTIDNNGKLVGDINHQSQHTLTNVELYALRNAEIKINIETEIPIYFLPNIELLRVTGDKKGTLDFSKNKTHADNPINIIIENTHVSFIGSDGEDRIFIAPNADMINAKSEIQMGQGVDWLLWQGNATAGGANTVSKDFKASGSLLEEDNNHNNMISANFLTKDIYLTTAENGKINGTIESNINNFSYFQVIDLANYKGTGSIYLDGHLVATEGKNVFDIGVIRSLASIHNTQYANVDHLTQASRPPSSFWKYATGDSGLALTGFADNVTVINMPVDEWGLTYSFRTLSVLGDATANSKVHFDYLYDDRYMRTTPVMTIKFNGEHIDKIDAGTLSFSIKQYQSPDPAYSIYGYINIESNGSAENTLRLAGDQNSIGAVSISGNKQLNLIIKNDFSNHLTRIDNSDTPVNLLVEKGGTGGGALYELLKSSSLKYATIVSELSGYQLNVVGSTEHDTFNIKGNTTITREINNQSDSDTIIFKESNINNMVTIKAKESSGDTTPTIHNDDKFIVGDTSNPWIFSTQGDYAMTRYGEYSLREAAALFNSLDLSPTANAFDLFSKTLSVATHGASETSLSQVGVLKLDNNSFVIIDSNNNHSFDSNDIVFSLGNMTVSDTLKLAHYTPPKIEVSGVAEMPQESILIG
ncbi:hypothetical protein ACRZXV_003322 [Serratia liquefaciens]